MENLVLVPIICAVLVVINIIFYVIARIRGHYYSTPASIIVSIFSNILFAMFLVGVFGITSPGDVNFAYIFCLSFYFPIVIIINMIVMMCSRDTIRNRKILINSDHTREDVEKFPDYIKKAHANPPLVKVKGNLSYPYFKTNGIKDYNNQLYKDYVQYKSWKADSTFDSSIDYNTNASFVIIYIDTDFDIDDSMTPIIEDREKNIETIVKMCEGNMCEMKRAYSIYNVKKMMKFTKGSCYQSFMSSCIGILIFFLSHLFGLSALFENILGLYAYSYSITVKKSVSATDKYPNGCYQADMSSDGGETCETQPIPWAPQLFALEGAVVVNQAITMALSGNRIPLDEMQISNLHVENPPYPNLDLNIIVQNPSLEKQILEYLSVEAQIAEENSYYMIRFTKTPPSMMVQGQNLLFNSIMMLKNSQNPQNQAVMTQPGMPQGGMINQQTNLQTPDYENPNANVNQFGFTPPPNPPPN